MSKKLPDIAKALVADSKGILAVDESSGTTKKRFDSISVASTKENRLAYREMLFTTPGTEDFISGIIIELLASKGIVPGIKADKGTKPLVGAPGEAVTEDLDCLNKRLGVHGW